MLAVRGIRSLGKEFNNAKKNLASLQGSVNNLSNPQRTFGDQVAPNTSCQQNSMFPFRSHKLYQGPIKAVILDWAGTVVDSGVKAPAFTFMELFRKEGIQITEDEARGPMGTHKRVHIEKILELDVVRQRWLKHKGSEATQKDIDRMYEQFVPTIMSCIHQHSDVIRGVPQTMEKLRNLGVKIGSTTGFPLSILNVILASSSKQGYVPDASVAADEVPAARPCPFMVWACAMRLGVFPPAGLIKVDDTVDGIAEGIAAGCWTVGVAKTSNYIGLSEPELDALPAKVLERKLAQSYDILANAGAHYVVDTVNELPRIVEELNMRLRYGQQP